MDCIRIHGLELWTHIGVPEEERKTEQRILCTVEIAFDALPVAKSDNIAEGIDYETVVQHIRGLAASERKTLEHLAEDIAAAVLSFSAAREVSISLKKFILPETESVEVKIVRKSVY